MYRRQTLPASAARASSLSSHPISHPAPWCDPSPGQGLPASARACLGGLVVKSRLGETLVQQDSQDSVRAEPRADGLHLRSSRPVSALSCPHSCRSKAGSCPDRRLSCFQTRNEMRSGGGQHPSSTVSVAGEIPARGGVYLLRRWPVLCLQ